MRTVRGLTVIALSTVTALALTGVLAGRIPSLPAGATTPHWQTTASFAPLVNVRAVSCAPNPPSASSATCVAVGDDGGHSASIIVTDDGGSTWTRSVAPAGVTTLSTVSCPSASICYAGGGEGIMKSSDGGSTWSIEDSTFPAQSISCFTIDECTAVGGLGIEATADGKNWSPQTPPTGTGILSAVSCPNAIFCVAVGTVNGTPSIIGVINGAWEVLTQPLITSLSAVSCFNGSVCTATGIDSSGATTLTTMNGGGSWALSTPNPTGKELNDVECPSLIDVHRRRDRPRFHSVRHRHVQQWRHLVISTRPGECCGPDGNLVLGRRRLHCRWLQREHGSGIDDHEHDYRRFELGSGRSAWRYQRA